MKIRIEQVNKPLAIFSYSSLTDIVLLLLIFFLLTSSFIVSSGLRVNLPEARTTQSVDKSHITITLLKSGETYINSSEVKSENFIPELSKVITDPKNQVIVLSSDKEVSLDRAVFVLDAAKSKGVTRFYISTIQRSK